MKTELIEQNVHRLLGAMTGAATTAMVAVGDQLGLYRALADGGPATQDELAARTGMAARYLREWLSQQAAAGFLAYREGDGGMCCRPRPPQPNATDDYAANLASPLAVLNYAASTFQCTPAALARSGKVALGAQAAPQRYGNWPATPASAGSGRSPRPRSTSCSSSGHNRAPRRSRAWR